MTDCRRQSFMLGTAIVDPVDNEIRIDGRTQRVEPRLIAVLQHLIEHAGQVVEREALLDAVWETRAAHDESLTQAISTLRTLLNDSARSPKFIKTVPKTGYRFIGQVQPVPAQPGRSSSGAVNAGLPDELHRSGRRPARIWLIAACVLTIALIVVLGRENDPDPDYDIDVEDIDIDVGNPDRQGDSSQTALPIG